jgi:class 3 adenylate cyclase/predicted ATPase
LGEEEAPAEGGSAARRDGLPPAQDTRASNVTSARDPVCSACGFVNPFEFRFCGGCGSALTRTMPESRPQPERRQLTILFCDLVGSSMLATQLDPEELRDLILAYQSACTLAIRRYDGTVSRYVGDGILALFGFPLAHEDDPERAVRAGLDIVAAIRKLPMPAGAGGTHSLAVRVGIATGLVVVGDLVGEGASEEHAVVGETPNLAARLQGLATPNAVVVSAGTRALLGERFECRDLGLHALHGFSEPVRASQVLAARVGASRFESAQPARLLPIVDRDEYTRWLRRLWHEAEHTGGRVALLSGEAGIGKSRIVEALREQIGGTPYAALRYQCSPHYVNTALHPVTEQIERAAGIAHEDTAHTKLERLATWLGSAAAAADAVPLLAALLSIPPDERFPMPAMSPQRQKERTFEVLLEFMQKLARVWPLPIVFEDAHWMDPTTKEFVTLLIARVRDMRALVVITFRPEFQPPWRAEHVEFREIEKLPPEHSMGLARRVAAERLPPETIDEVVAKTDGVPLFIEELTRAVVDTALATEQQDLFTLRSTNALRTIPSTLQDSLMARLDQLGAAKSVAQIAGAIGREFSYDLLEAVADLPPQRLREDLRVLEASDLIYPESRLDGESYAFKHALVQEAAYNSLLRTRRRELHERIAAALETRFPQTARDAPELVAHHWTEAGVIDRGVTGWLTAGQRASQRSEYREAIAHLRRGLELIPRLGDAHAQRERELALLLALGPALITTEGGGTSQVAAVYARALELCDAKTESPAHFVAQWGAWRISMNHATGRQRADKLLHLAQRIGEPELLVQAHHCQWATLYMLGAHAECCRHIEAGLSVYDSKHDRSDSALYGSHDARVCGLGEGALAQWMLGRADSALGYMRSSLSWADELAHVGSRVHAMDYALVLQKFRRDIGAVYERASELHDYASEQKLRVHCAKGAFFRGWARAMLYDTAAGLAEMLEGIASEKDADTPTDFPLYYEMLAEIYGKAGRVEDGLLAIDEAFAVASRQGIVFWNAELHRRRGVLLLASGQAAAARHCFEEALTCARTHAARSLELRAAVSLARLCNEQDELETATEIVRPLYEIFTEGHATPDLAEARQLIEELHERAR